MTLLVALAFAPPVQAVPPDGPVPLRVLSFNVHHGAGPDDRVDLDRLAAEIRATGADVVGLQEVDRHYGERSGSVDQAGDLAARLGMHVVFGAHVDLEPPAPGAPRRQYGTAILSRFQVVSWTDTLLPSADPAEEPRGLLEAVVAAPDGPVRVATTHLSAGNPGSRLAQARAVAARLDRSAEPVLLLGDLNAPPTAPEVTLLTARLADAGRAGGATFPAGAPAERIDYVLGEGRFTGYEVRPTASSDHRPVLAAVLLDRPA
jgi:endonuclease/exonuclease/phosphatase family metal-dependent hydrolase